MKTAVKIFIWIGMIIQCFLIVPIIIGIIALIKLENAVSRSELIFIGFLTFFFCSRIGGLLMLGMKNSDLW